MKIFAAADKLMVHQNNAALAALTILGRTWHFAMGLYLASFEL